VLISTIFQYFQFKNTSKHKTQANKRTRILVPLTTTI